MLRYVGSAPVLTVSPMAEPVTDRQRRAEGAFLAAAIGDALGWPVELRGNRVGGMRGLVPKPEFVEWQRREGSRYAPHERPIPAGTYSDDTQLLLAVARSLQRGPDWWTHLTRTELPLWLVYELGGGGATRLAARAWNSGHAPWGADARPGDRERYFSAGGNGVVMRILPHAIAGAEDSTYENVRARIAADAIVTHGHPRALVGAQAIGYALWQALRWNGRVAFGALLAMVVENRSEWAATPDFQRVAPDWDEARNVFGRDYDRVWSLTVEEMTGLLMAAAQALGRGSVATVEATLDELGAFGDEGGAGTRTAAAALYLASRYLTDPRAGLLAGAFARGSDTDTLACVTGALLGALAGREWIGPWGDGLLDQTYVVAMASATDRQTPMQPGRPWDASVRRAFNAHLAGLQAGDALHLPVFGNARVERIEDPHTKARKDIRIWWLSTQVGQTLAISRTVDAPAPWLRDAGAGRQMSREAARQAAQPVHHRDEEPIVWHRLGVADLERSVDFYTRFLRLKLIRRSDDRATVAPNLLLEQAGDTDETPAQLALTRDEANAGDHRLLIYVDLVSLERYRDRLHDAGGGAPRLEHKGSTISLSCLDPDGHVVELRANDVHISG